MTRTLSFLFTMLAAISFARAENYCLAIRGNGELAPAHWGGMSRIVETLGLPQKQAGGSSASISMFLLDAVASNPLIQNQSSEEQKVSASLLIKSLHGYLIYLSQTQEFKDVQMLFQQGSQLSQSAISKDINALVEALKAGNVSTSLTKAKSLADAALKMGILNTKLYGQVTESVNILKTSGLNQDTTVHAARIQFIFAELQKTISVFGKFNAENDVNLFFRPGIISFSGLADQLGRIANFYSQNAAQPASLQHLNSFISSCKDDARNKTWIELLQSRPDCQGQLMTAINAYFVQEQQNLNFSSNDIGKTIQSFPTTSVLVASAYKEAKTALNNYETSMSAEYGKSFVLSNPKDVRFGYWGSFPVGFKKNLPKDDAKSARFYSLGMASWKTALSLSPAEPGLSPLLEFKTKNTSLISAGGWSDLHPVVVLKASGCENVVYLNRRGGESMFAQGVAKRLLNYERSWDVLKTQPSQPNDPQDISKINSIINNKGDAKDMTSLWSQLYNMANPNSSYNRALKEADAVLCTDWNDFDSFKKDGISLMIDNAYKSSYYVSFSSDLFKRSDLAPRLNPTEQNPNGYPANIGCHP